MCRAFDRTIHSDCFLCSTCGNSLTNEGHYFINDKFYCEIHGRQIRGDNTITNRNEMHWPTARQPKMVQIFDKYQHRPNVITPQSISISPTPWKKTQSPISPNNQGVPPAAAQYGHELNELRKEVYDSSMCSAVNRNTHPSTPSNAPEPQNGEVEKSRARLRTVSNNASRCEDCKQEIRGAYILANGLAYCPNHFVCSNKPCGRKLLDIGFVEEKGRKYCDRCFETEIAPRCAKCNDPITSDCLNALQKQWHPHCFVCTHCHHPFGNSAFFLEQGLPYCETDWNTLFTTKCVSCHYPIEAGDRWLEALGAAFHSNCFNCTSCNVNLEGQSFYAKNGAPYCKLHA